MRKKVSIILAIFTLCGSLYAFTWEPPFGWPTKDNLSLSYAQGFHARRIGEEMVYGMSGSFKYDRAMFFKESPVGFGYAFEIGGPFWFDMRDKRYTADILDLGFNFYNALGVAFNVPVNKNFELYAIVGPGFDIWKVLKDEERIFSFQFGSYVGIGARVMPSSIVSFSFGVEGIYNFLQAGYHDERKLESIISLVEVKPYMGISFKLDSWYDKFRKK